MLIDTKYSLSDVLYAACQKLDSRINLDIPCRHCNAVRGNNDCDVCRGDGYEYSIYLTDCFVAKTILCNIRMEVSNEGTEEFYMFNRVDENDQKIRFATCDPHFNSMF